MEENEIVKDTLNNKLENRQNVNRYGRQKLTLKEESDLANKKREMKVRCPNCGYLVPFYAFDDKDKKICRYCKRYIFKNKNVEFKYRLKEKLKELNER